MNQTIELIQSLVRERFYGALTIKFEAGRVVIIKKEETIKPLEKPLGLPEEPEKRKDEKQEEGQESH
jgi:hypothetical protein